VAARSEFAADRLAAAAAAAVGAFAGALAAVGRVGDEARPGAHRVERLAQVREAERSASGLREENARCISKGEKDCKVMTRKVEEALASRIDEVTTMKKKLEHIIEETDRKIQKMAESMSKTGANLRSHQEPEAILTSREKFRQAKPGPKGAGENIGDPVTTSLDKHKYRLRRNQKHLEQSAVDEENTIRMLEECKKDLMSDLGDKVQALTIDLRCRNWAAQRVTIEKLDRVPKGPAFVALEKKVAAMRQASAR